MLKLIPTEYINDYNSKVNFDLSAQFNKISFTDFKEDIFFYNTNSVASSAKIEGEIASSSDLIKYLKYKTKFKASYINPSKDLFNAYIFAQKNSFTKENILKVHALLSENILEESSRGQIRTHDEVVLNDNGEIIYTATSKEEVGTEFEKLIHDIEELLTSELSINEIFYYGFMISISFVKIHPFEDGNGRTSRLLEKWFIAEKLGKKAWFINSELNYYNKRNDYFLALNQMGLFYENTDYRKALSIADFTVGTLREV